MRAPRSLLAVAVNAQNKTYEQRLADLVRRLGTEHDGEIIATVRALGRTLASRGLTFTDLGNGKTEVVAHQTNVPEMFRSPEAQTGMQSSFDRFAAYVAAL